MVIESYFSPMRSPWCSDENLGRSLSIEVRSKFVYSFIINNLFIVRIYATFSSYISLVVSGLGYRLWWNLITESLSLWVFLNCQLFLPLLLFLPNVKCHHHFFLISEMLKPGGKPAGFSGWTLLSAIPASALQPLEALQERLWASGLSFCSETTFFFHLFLLVGG